MTDLKQKYADKLHWLEMGIPYSDHQDINPNEHVFILAMAWHDVEPILERIAKLEEKHYHTINFLLDNGDKSPKFQVDGEGVQQIRDLVAKYKALKDGLNEILEKINEKT